MNRRNFFKRSAIGAAVVAVNPLKLLAEDAKKTKQPKKEKMTTAFMPQAFIDDVPVMSFDVTYNADISLFENEFIESNQQSAEGYATISREYHDEIHSMFINGDYPEFVCKRFANELFGKIAIVEISQTLEPGAFISSDIRFIFREIPQIRELP